LLRTERRITEAGLAQVGSGLLPVGTVLLSSRAPIGYLAISEIPIAINQGFIAMVCDTNIPPLYVWFWAEQNMGRIKGRANGTTFQEISKSNFRPIPVDVPPKPLLERFIAAAEPLHRRIVANAEESVNLAQIRDSLMQRLLAGEVGHG
jgi:type I restriction enzyme S subunit